MSKLIAVNGFSYSISDASVLATVTMTGMPSVKCKANGQGICKDSFGVTVSAITKPPATIPDPGPYNVTFSATATKVKADGSLVLRVDDVTGNIKATPQVPGSPPTPQPVTFHLTITDANQTKAKAV
jgi:hypothetical protein